MNDETETTIRGRKKELLEFFCRLNGSREYHRISGAQKLFIIRWAATTKKIPTLPDSVCFSYVSFDVEQLKKILCFRVFSSLLAAFGFCQQRYGWHSISFAINSIPPLSHMKFMATGERLVTSGPLSHWKKNGIERQTKQKNRRESTNFLAAATMVCRRDNKGSGQF